MLFHHRNLRVPTRLFIIKVTRYINFKINLFTLPCITLLCNFLLLKYDLFIGIHRLLLFLYQIVILYSSYKFANILFNWLLACRVVYLDAQFQTVSWIDNILIKGTTCCAFTFFDNQFFLWTSCHFHFLIENRVKYHPYQYCQFLLVPQVLNSIYFGTCNCCDQDVINPGFVKLFVFYKRPLFCICTFFLLCVPTQMSLRQACW